MPSRRSSFGPDSTLALISRLPSASLRAAASRPFSGRLTHRARPNARSAAPIIATAQIVPKRTQSATISRSSGAVDRIRITVPSTGPPSVPGLKTGTAAIAREPVVPVMA